MESKVDKNVGLGGTLKVKEQEIEEKERIIKKQLTDMTKMGQDFETKELKIKYNHIKNMRSTAQVLKLQQVLKRLMRYEQLAVQRAFFFIKINIQESHYTAKYRETRRKLVAQENIIEGLVTGERSLEKMRQSILRNKRFILLNPQNISALPKYVHHFVPPKHIKTPEEISVNSDSSIEDEAEKEQLARYESIPKTPQAHMQFLLGYYDRSVEREREWKR